MSYKVYEYPADLALPNPDVDPGEIALVFIGSKGWQDDAMFVLAAWEEGAFIDCDGQVFYISANDILDHKPILPQLYSLLIRAGARLP